MSYCKKVALSLIILFSLNACEAYRYVPHSSTEKPATIDYSFNGEWKHHWLLNDEFMMLPKDGSGMRIYSINGKSVGFLKSNPTIKNNRIQLSPGTNEIKFAFLIGTQTSWLSCVFNADAGAHYSLNLVSNSVQILNESHDVVKEINYNIRSYYY